MDLWFSLEGGEEKVAHQRVEVGSDLELSVSGCL
jgi:hypothetical protein